MVSMTIVAQLTNVDAECCKSVSVAAMDYFMDLFGIPDKCGPWCCGCGACNIFCCNCKDGCNHLWTSYWNNRGYSYPFTCNHRKRGITGSTFRNVSLEAAMLFKSIDINGNNAITNEEAAKYLENSAIYKRSTSFSLHQELGNMDINNDGIISPEEFDESLKL